MRRVVTALVLVMVAGMFVACSSPDASTTTGTPVPAAGVPAPAPTSAAAQGDILSPLPASVPIKKFPIDPASVPTLVLENLTARKPMLVFWFDPTTKVSADQRVEINAVIRKYVGHIDFFSFDYTTGIPAGSAEMTLPIEIDKAERMTGLLDVNTTPYIVFVDASGQITHRFAGFVDRGLIEREVMRVTQ